MADDEKKVQGKPKKSILKQSTSFDKASQKTQKMKWDEMNILATFHPEGKDYGHNKIDEPPTPYNYMSDMDDTEAAANECSSCAVDPADLASKLEGRCEARKDGNEQSEEDDDVNMDVTEEEKSRRASFQEKRKLHYNEFYAMKLAKELMEQEDDDDDDGDKQTDKQTTDANAEKK